MHGDAAAGIRLRSRIAVDLGLPRVGPARRLGRSPAGLSRLRGRATPLLDLGCASSGIISPGLIGGIPTSCIRGGGALLRLVGGATLRLLGSLTPGLFCGGASGCLAGGLLPGLLGSALTGRISLGALPGFGCRPLPRLLGSTLTRVLGRLPLRILRRSSLRLSLPGCFGALG